MLIKGDTVLVDGQRGVVIRRLNVPRGNRRRCLVEWLETWRHADRYAGFLTLIDEADIYVPTTRAQFAR